MPEARPARPTLRDLQRRLEALEAALLPTTTGSASAGGPPRARDRDADPHWALDGLRSRLPAPGGVLWAGFFEGPDGLPAAQQYAIPVGPQLDQPWSPLADVLQALGHPVRLELLRALLSGKCSTSELLGVLGAGSTGQLYHHLTQLTAAGWARPAGRGRFEVPPARRIPLLAVIAAAR